MTYEERFAELENNLSRTSKNVHEMGEVVERLNTIMFGKMDDETNERIKGYIDRVADIQALLLSSQQSKKDWFKIIRDSVFTLLVLYIAYKLGVRS